MTKESLMTPHDVVTLGPLVEESGEVLQALGKAMRHGFQTQDTHVTGSGKYYDNLADIEKECSDFIGAVLFASARGLLNWSKISSAADEKNEKLQRIHGL